ncbi:MAG: restriction endonuclease subunit S [bacterium]|nr:restriction endonuclease subunit S [bacterium]MDW8164831.1 restriction endonuclease subunit S [Candidatus Omnitrophota bacterium]
MNNNSKTKWPIKKLGEVALVNWGNTSITKKQYVERGYPAYSAAGQDGFLTYYEHEGPAIILSAIGARCGKCFLAEGKWTAIKNTIIILPNEKLLDIKFLFLFLNDESKWKQTGGAQPFISEKHAKQFPIPLPPLEIQKKIVAKIEELFEKIDKAIELRQKALQETEQIFQSALNQVFTEAEKKWGVSVLKNCVKEDRKQTSPNDRKRLPYVGMEDIESNTGKLVVEPKPKDIKSNTFLFNSNHILYGKLRPYLNKVFVPNFEGHCTTEFIPLLADSNILCREWLARWLQQKSIVDILTRTVTGARMPRADMSVLFNLNIPLPPLSEQKRIVEYLDSLREKVERMKQLQQAQLDELKTLKESILNKAFNGELIKLEQ